MPPLRSSAPTDIWRHIFSFDGTYRQHFGMVLLELELLDHMDACDVLQALRHTYMVYHLGEHGDTMHMYRFRR